MDTLGTEVGQKMRCAVKAKLIELGTGSTSGGYIDDELPDYVMIMVANKRSKKQMRDDLQLFLNENTDTFVNWLHQVLDKLQEVTLPPAIIQKASGKGTSSSAADGKKEKKSKKQKRSQKDQSPPKSSASTVDTHHKHHQPTASITDVFADQLIGKAKRSLEIESQAPVKKQESRKEVPVNDFNIPSVTDLVKNAVVNSKRKEIEELEQIQKQIDEAKRQLKIIPGDPITSTKEKVPEPSKAAAPVDDNADEEDDEDFLNLKADDLDDEDNDSQSKEAQDKGESPSSNNHRRNRSPIVFDRSRQRHSPEAKARDSTEDNATQGKERLSGNGKTENIISLSAHRQMERELYTPVHRRREDTNTNQSNPTTTTASLSTRRPPRNSSGDPDQSRQRHRPSDSRDRVPDSRERPSDSRDRRSGGADRPGPVNNRFRDSERLERERLRDRERHSMQQQQLQQHRQRSPHRRERSPQRMEARHRPPMIPRDPSPKFIIADKRSPPVSRAHRIEITRTVLEEPAPVPKERLPVRQRIGSRVIVAPPKLVEEEEAVDVPVSSVVTIKPRPVVAKNRQANKNLLLRAMADAQKSMVGTLTKQMEPPAAQTLRLTQKLKTEGVVGIKSRLGGIAGGNANKRQRSQINAIVSSLDAVVKRQKPNEKIIIEIGPNDGFSDSDFEDDVEEEVVDEDDVEERLALESLHAAKKNGLGISAEQEYVPKPVVELGSVRSKEATGIVHNEAPVEDEEELAVAAESASNTQFVVTLDGAFKKSAASAVRKRVEVANRKEVAAVEQHKKLPPVEKNTDVGHGRSRVSSRSAGAGGVVTGAVVAKKQDSNERASRPLVDLRQRVQEKRNGSPVINRRDNGGRGGSGDRAQTSPTLAGTRKRRSPINFADKRHDNGERQANNRRETKKEEASEVPQRKRIRITNSPTKDDTPTSKVSNGDESKSKVVVVSKEKEKRDPKKYDNIPPLLSSVAVPASGSTIGKVLERCKFFPNCTRGDSCEFVHPSTTCKSFPNCKFGESCLYIHPKCKFDLACVRADCNFSHTPVSSSAPPLSSHIVAVQNYKTISTNPLPAICRFYPNCNNSVCTYFHPKMCFYGTNCPNKMDCNFYHHEIPAADKFKWVSPMTG